MPTIDKGSGAEEDADCHLLTVCFSPTCVLSNPDTRLEHGGVMESVTYLSKPTVGDPDWVV